MRLVSRPARISSRFDVRWCALVVGAVLLVERSSQAQTLPSSAATSLADDPAFADQAAASSASAPATAPVSAAGAAAAKKSWLPPIVALASCATSSCVGLLLWLPVLAPVGCLVPLLLVVPGGNTTSAFYAVWGVLLLTAAILPFAGTVAAANAMLAPLLVGIAAAIDSVFADRAWWPAVVGAALTWPVLAAGAGIGAAVVGPRYLDALSQVPVLWIVAAVGLVLSPLVPPLALAGALTAGLFSPGPVADRRDVVMRVGALVVAGGLLAAIGFGGAVAYFNARAGTADVYWGEKQASASWGLTMLAGLGVSLATVAGGTVAIGSSLFDVWPGGGVE